jgi:hypothetical protein
MNITEINTLSNFIEQNLRSSQSAGLKFIDSGNLQSRLANKQNHVVFGRRGAGKSTFMTSLNGNDFIAVYVDIDAYKDISFPDIVIKVLVVIFEQLRHATNKRLPFYKHPFKWFKKKKLLEKIDKFIKDLNKLLDLPDVEQKQIRTKISEGRSQNDSLSLGSYNAGIKITDGQNFGTEEETQRTVPFDKLNSLKKKIVDFQGVFHEASAFVPALRYI